VHRGTWLLVDFSVHKSDTPDGPGRDTLGSAAGTPSASTGAAGCFGILLPVFLGRVQLFVGMHG